MNCPAIPSEPIVIVLRHEWEYGLVREIRLTCSPDPTDMAVWGCRDTNNDPLPVFDWRETDLVTVTEIGVPSGWAPVRTTWQYGDEAPAPEFPRVKGQSSTRTEISSILIPGVLLICSSSSAAISLVGRRLPS